MQKVSSEFSTAGGRREWRCRARRRCRRPWGKARRRRWPSCGRGTPHGSWRSEGTHTGTSTTTEGVGDLETWRQSQPSASRADDIENLVDQLGTLSVVTLCPVVTSTRLAEDEVVGAEKLTERSSADGVHGAGLQIDKNGTRNDTCCRRPAMWSASVVMQVEEVQTFSTSLK